MSISPAFLDELRARVPVSRIVGRKVTWDLRRSNQAKGDWWSPCPFHGEKTASFHVDDQKGFYYCFGCHAKGDALTFLREAEGLYRLDDGAVRLVEQTLFRADVRLPANLIEGAYSARIFLLRDGKVIDRFRAPIEVRKVGLERWLYRLALDRPFIYGIMSLAIAIAAGWGASAAFRLAKRG